jgi:hypothetical protein
VVDVVDDTPFGAGFGPDGTQPLPPDPVLPDPLGGLVTGSVFADPLVAVVPLIEVRPVPAPTAAQAHRSNHGVRRQTTTVPSLAPAAPPPAIPVAQSLPDRPRRVSRPSVATPTQVAVAPAVRRTRNQPPRWTATPSRPAPSRPAPRATRRRSGAGCAVFLIIVVLVVAAFVVLGVVTGNGGGFGSGGG